MYQANLIMVMTVYENLGFLNNEAEKVELKGTSFLTGIEKTPPRSEKCIEFMQGVYILKYFLLYHIYFKDSQ